QMTVELVEEFRKASGVFPIEPDSSSGSYFWAADWLLRRGGMTSFSRVSVQQWPNVVVPLQIDTQFPKRIQPDLPAQLSRQNELGDSIMTAIVIAPFAGKAVRFTD